MEDTQPPVRNITEACVLLLNASIGNDGIGDGTRALKNQRDRFLLWAHDVQARTGELDHRLRKALNLKKCTLDLLQDLVAQLQSIQADSTVDDIIDEVADIVDNLVRLEKALDDPSPLSEGTDLQKSGASIGLHLRPHPSTSRETTIDVRNSADRAFERNLDILSEKVRFTSGRSDIDILAISGPQGSLSWSPRTDSVETLETSWIATILPNDLENNGIFARIMHFTARELQYDGSNTTPIHNEALSLVNFLGTHRRKDPERPIFIIAHSSGGLIAKLAISMLVREGSSVATENPICGCLFFGVPHSHHKLETSDILAWVYLNRFPHRIPDNASSESLTQHFKAQFAQMTDSDQVRIRQAAEYVSQTITECSKLFDLIADLTDVLVIECMERTSTTESARLLPPELWTRSTKATNPARRLEVDFPRGHFELPHFESASDRDDLLSIVHHIARTAERVMNVKDENDQTALPGQMVEDPFAILASFKTSILVNDTESSGPAWTTMIDIVRDCVDITLNYAVDVDMLLSNQELKTYGVDDSARAVRDLNDALLPDTPWDFLTQLKDYLNDHFSNGDQSDQGTEAAQPCNIVVLTSCVPSCTLYDVEAILQDVARTSNWKSPSAPSAVIQFVLVHPDANNRDSAARVSWEAFQLGRSAASIAPPYGPLLGYRSDANVCKRILLGAISPRFAVIDFVPVIDRTRSDFDGLARTSTAGSVSDMLASWGHSASKASTVSSFEDMNVDAGLERRLNVPDRKELNEQMMPMGATSLPMQGLAQSGLPLTGSRFENNRRNMDAPDIEVNSVPLALTEHLKPLSEPQRIDTKPLGASIARPNFREDDTSKPVEPGSSRPRSASVVGRQRSASSTAPRSLSASRVGSHDGVSKLRRSSSPFRVSHTFGSKELAHGSFTGSGHLSSVPTEPSVGGSINSTNSETSRRTQKHPATFQCTLCPKRFTRAYNLRSHLRTHTDERPFVCTVCGKAFARQHDRKRHEGLHSGEKKFVCRGTCTSSTGEMTSWGCGRRFARADALGRHVRSEEGRVCIKPLLEEERREQKIALQEEERARKEAWDEVGAHMPSRTVMIPYATDPSNDTRLDIPAALYEQYPALHGVDWSQMSTGINDVGGSGGSTPDPDVNSPQPPSLEPQLDSRPTPHGLVDPHIEYRGFHIQGN